MSKLKGFSLIELMIAVAVLGLLAAIAYPAYQHQVSKSRRMVAESALTEIASRMEAYRFRNRTYTQNLADLGYGVDGDNAWNTFPEGAASGDNYYRVQVEAADSGCAIANCYRLIADPQNAQGGDAWQYRIWSTGRKQSREDSSDSWEAGWPGS